MTDIRDLHETDEMLRRIIQRFLESGKILDAAFEFNESERSEPDITKRSISVNSQNLIKEFDLGDPVEFTLASRTDCVVAGGAKKEIQAVTLNVVHDPREGKPAHCGISSWPPCRKMRKELRSKLADLFRVIPTTIIDS